jgi:hypothetical protein
MASAQQAEWSGAPSRGSDVSWRRLIDVEDGKRKVDWPRLIIVMWGSWAVFGIVEALVPGPWFWIGMAASAPALVALDVYLRRKP